MSGRTIDRKNPAKCPACGEQVRHGPTSRVIWLDRTATVALCDRCGYDRELEERRARVARLVPHEVATWFPMLAEDQLRELADDIKANGLGEPLLVLGDVLIDGRNRRAACELAGVVPDLADYTGPADAIPVLVISRNLHRRHLNTSQRAMIAARLAQLRDGQRQVRQLADVPTQAEAAERLNVGERSVQRAREVLEGGDPELVRKVDGAELTVSGAAAELRGRAEKLVLAKSLIAEVNPDALELRQVLDGQAPRKVRAAIRTERRANDAYYTPRPVARACMSRVGPIPEGFRVLEPSVGGGAWAELVPTDAELTVLDIDPAAKGLELAPPERSIVGDFLTHDFGETRFKRILGNPPFADAEAHVRRALGLLEPGGQLFFLLRRNWIAAARFRFLEDVRSSPSFIPWSEWVLGPRRVSFTGDEAGVGGTDMQEYSLFEWRHDPCIGLPRTAWLTSFLRWTSDPVEPTV